MPYNSKFNLLSGVITTTTSAGVYIGDREKLSVQYSSTGPSSGNATLVLQVSDDGVNYVTYNRLVSNIGAGTAFTTKTFTVGGSNDVIFFPEGDHFGYLRAYLNYKNAVALAVTVVAVGVIS